MNRSMLATILWMLFSNCAPAESVTWEDIYRTVMTSGYYRVRPGDHCDEVEIDGDLYQLCPKDNQAVQHESNSSGPLAALVDFGEFGDHRTEQMLTVEARRLLWSSSGHTQSQAGGAGSQWYTGGGLFSSELVMQGRLARPTSFDVTANLSVIGDNFAEDFAMLQIHHVDANFNERFYEWRVSCDSICTRLPDPLSIDEQFVLPAGHIIVTAGIFGSGGYTWDSPRLNADFVLAYAPVPEPASVLSAVVALVTTAGAVVVKSRRRTNS